MPESSIGGLELGYYIATFVIAAVAIVSLWFNIRSGRKTAETLEKVREAFTAFVDPLLVFTSYQWVNDQHNVPFSKDNIPKGIRAAVKNVSNIPLQIWSNKMKVNLGNRQLSDPLTTTESEGPVIVEPGAEIGNMVIQKEEFQRLLPEMSNSLDKPPFLTLNLEVEFARLNTEYRLLYAAEIFIAANIDNPTKLIWAKNSEKISPCINK